jgi:hypothetical protein
MESAIVQKIRTLLQRGIATESEVVYFLVEIRKLMDMQAGRKDRAAEKYASLRLYCNWVAHTDLSNTQAREIVKQADAAYPKLLDGTLTETEKNEFRRIFDLNSFREDLSEFLRHCRLPPFSDGEWNRFLASFLNVIVDCPLVCKVKDPKLNDVDEIVLIRNVGDGDNIPDVTAPEVMWGMLFQGKLRLVLGTNFKLSQSALNSFEEFVRTRGEAGQET